MPHRADDDPATPRFDASDPWRLVQRGLHPHDAARDETLFTVGNGTIGVRGSFEEGGTPGAPSVPGHFLNGVHEREPLIYPEGAYGLARWRQTMLNVPAFSRIDLTLDGQAVRGDDERASDLIRTLDMEGGTLTRTFLWTAADGARTQVRFERFASFANPHRFALHVSLTPLDRPVQARLRHPLDGHVRNRVETGDPRVGSALHGQVLRPVAHRNERAGPGPHAHRRALRLRAPGSGMELIVLADLAWEGATSVEVRCEAEPLRAEGTLVAEVAPSDPLRAEVRIVAADARYSGGDGDALDAFAGAEADAWAQAGGVRAEREAHQAFLTRYWSGANVRIDGDPAMQQAIRFALFQLLQGTARDGVNNVPAKALSGEGYEGHTFWDTEIYVQPMFLHVAPEIAGALMRYRIAMLDAARERARELGYAGALYPWRTIAGPEASAYFPAGTAQIHIDADIAFALLRTVHASGDDALLWEGGLAVLCECARFYRSVQHQDADGNVRLATVTGPDEYTALVDDDHYTNAMARACLQGAADTARRLADSDPERYAAWAQRLHLSEAEVDDWDRAARAVWLPVDPASGVTPQDATFLVKPEWPFGSEADARRPLLLHHHPLTLYRHQVLKQPSVLLAHLLLHATRTQLRRDEAYYTPRTSFDSSLAFSVHAVIAARLGRTSEADAYLRRTARIDLDDLAGNVADGLHAAAMAGSWMAIVQGFGGFDGSGDEPAFHPRLPRSYTGLAFAVAWRGQRIRVEIDHDVTRYRLTAGAPLTVRHQREALQVGPDAWTEVPTTARLRGVAFDLDGVLADSAEHHYRAWQELADELGVPFDREANEALRGVPRRESLDAILARAADGGARWSHAEREELAARKNERYRALLTGVTPADLLPGIPELLADLKGAGVRLALASSSRNAPELLERLGIADRFDAVVDPAALRFGKPDGEIFEAAAEALDLPVEACVGVEDAPAGVDAVHQAGMAAVAVGPGDRFPAATVVVPSTAELTLAVLQHALRTHAARVDTPQGRR